MARTLKTAEQMQRHLKGIANHHRINMLLLIDEEGGITVEKIAERLGVHYQTVAQHGRYLAHAGLVDKKYKGRAVTHVLSPYGQMLVGFIKEFQRIGTH